MPASLCAKSRMTVACAAVVGRDRPDVHPPGAGGEVRLERAQRLSDRRERQPGRQSGAGGGQGVGHVLRGESRDRDGHVEHRPQLDAFARIRDARVRRPPQHDHLAVHDRAQDPTVLPGELGSLAAGIQREEPRPSRTGVVPDPHERILRVEHGPALRSHDAHDRGLRPRQLLLGVDALQPQVVGADVGEHRDVHGGHAHATEHQPAPGGLQDREAQPWGRQHLTRAARPGPVPRLDLLARHVDPVRGAPGGEQTRLGGHPPEQARGRRLAVGPGHRDRRHRRFDEPRRPAGISGSDERHRGRDPLVHRHVRPCGDDPSDRLAHAPRPSRRTAMGRRPRPGLSSRVGAPLDPRRPPQPGRSDRPPPEDPRTPSGRRRSGAPPGRGCPDWVRRGSAARPAPWTHTVPLPAGSAPCRKQVSCGGKRSRTVAREQGPSQAIPVRLAHHELGPVRSRRPGRHGTGLRQPSAAAGDRRCSGGCARSRGRARRRTDLPAAQQVRLAARHPSARRPGGLDDRHRRSGARRRGVGVRSRRPGRHRRSRRAGQAGGRDGAGRGPGRHRAGQPGRRAGARGCGLGEPAADRPVRGARRRGARPARAAQRRVARAHRRSIAPRPTCTPRATSPTTPTRTARTPCSSAPGSRRSSRPST